MKNRICDKGYIEKSDTILYYLFCFLSGATVLSVLGLLACIGWALTLLVRM